MRSSWLILLILAAPGTVFAQGAADVAEGWPLEKPLPLRLRDAIDIAVVRSYSIRQVTEDIAVAEGRTKRAWGSVYPSLDASASYQRNISAQNPFAGSSAGTTFGGIGWLINNEIARTDPGSGLMEQTLDEFLAQSVTTGNPFLIENQFRAGLTLNQIIYNGAAFSGIKGSELLVDASRAGVDREIQTIISRVSQAFYGSLLAERQVIVLDASATRAKEAADEARQRVERGVSPQFDLLSAEVDQANNESALLRARAEAQESQDALKVALGLPPMQAIELRGEIREPGALELGTMLEDEAIALALDKRPDLRRARITLEIRGTDEDITFAGYLPELYGFVNLGVVGNVPADRTTFDVQGNATGELGFFASDYWFTDFNLGLKLSWNLFNGFATRAEMSQKRAETRRARAQYEQLTDIVKAEVRRAIRNLQTAREQIQTQERNVSRAELSYQHAQARVREGVSTQVELRSASNQLDRTQLSYLQAVHDYLVAWVDLQVAVGRRPSDPLAAPDPDPNASETEDPHAP